VPALWRVPRMLASMRPRPNGRGNEGTAAMSKQGEHGFNEAAAEWPRESRSVTETHGRWPRFNEAAAEWPRE